MRLTRITVIGILVSTISCGCAHDPAKTEKPVEVTSISSSVQQLESVEDLISSANSVEYKVNGEWVSASDKTQELIESIQDLLPESLGETATFYNPDSVVIRYHLPTSEHHLMSMEDREVSVEVSSIEISDEGIVFLMPQGMSLGVIKDVESMIPAQ